MAVLMAIGFLPGCTDQNQDTWYEDAQRGIVSRDDYIRAQVDQGIDPKAARSQYDLKVFTLQTEGRDPGKAFQ